MILDTNTPDAAATFGRHLRGNRAGLTAVLADFFAPGNIFSRLTCKYSRKPDIISSPGAVAAKRRSNARQTPG